MDDVSEQVAEVIKRTWSTQFLVVVAALGVGAGIMIGYKLAVTQPTFEPFVPPVVDNSGAPVDNSEAPVDEQAEGE